MFCFTVHFCNFDLLVGLDPDVYAVLNSGVDTTLASLLPISGSILHKKYHTMATFPNHRKGNRPKKN